MRKLVLFMLLFTDLYASAQDKFATIRCEVYHADQPLAGATIKLYLDTLLIKQQSTQIFPKLKPGNYKIITSYTSLKSDTSYVVLQAALDTVVKIVLQSKHNEFAEVVIRSTIPPASVRNDTLAFNTSAFPTRAHATVSDLLKKLPGVEVDDQGNVTMQGKKVDNIYIDGKPFFINDPRTATQNLPADIVSQVESFDTQSEESRSLGRKEIAKTKTLNLKLKKSKKTGIFGKAYTSAGNDGAYSAGLNLTTLSEKPWFSLFSGADNINGQFNGQEQSFGAGSGLQSARHLDLLYKETFSKTLTLLLDAGYRHAKSTLNNQDQRLTNLGDSSLLSHQNTNSYNSNNNYNLYSLIEYKPKDGTGVSYNGSVSRQTGDMNAMGNSVTTILFPASSYIASQGTTQNSKSTRGFNWNQSLNFYHRFNKKGRNISIDIFANGTTQNANNQLLTRLDTADVNQIYTQPGHNENEGLRAAYDEPIGTNHLFKFRYDLNLQKSYTEKDYTDSLLINTASGRLLSQQVSAAISNAAESKLFYQGGVGWLFSQQSNVSENPDSHFSHNYNNFIPTAVLRYTAQPGSILSLHYEGNEQAPQAEQLQPIPDLSNPLLLKVGNPELQPSFSHHFDANFSRFNGENFHSLQFNLSSTLTERPISVSTTILAGGAQQLEYVNTAPTINFNGGATIGFPLDGQKHGNGNLGLHAGYGEESSALNGAENHTRNFTEGEGLRLNYHAGSKVFIEVTTSLDYTGQVYLADMIDHTHTWIQRYGADCSWQLPLNFSVFSHYNLQRISSTNLPAQSASLLNAAVAKDLFKSKILQLRLSGFNLLNTSSANNQTTGANYTETSQSNTLARTLLFSLIYHFQNFKSS